MKRRLLCFFAVWMLLGSMALPMALASETEETTQETTEETTEETRKNYSTATSGTCGKDARWQLDGSVLTITGTGAIDAGQPWEFYKDTIETLILQGEITAIGDQAFSTCNNLRYIDFGSSLKEIGYQAFFSCNALEAIRLPDTFRKFGQECFKDCDGLQVVFCEGPMPSFKGSCLYTNHTVQVLYTAETPWPWEETSRLVSNFGSRIHVDVGSASVLDDYWHGFPDVSGAAVAVAAEPVPTAAETTAPTVPETTVPVTTAPPPTMETVPLPTAAVIIAPTAAEEEVVFQLESEPLFVTEPEHVPSQDTAPQQEKEGFGPVTWIIIIAAALTGILVLALVIRMVLHSGGKYER